LITYLFLTQTQPGLSKIYKIPIDSYIDSNPPPLFIMPEEYDAIYEMGEFD